VVRPDYVRRLPRFKKRLFSFSLFPFLSPLRVFLYSHSPLATAAASTTAATGLIHPRRQHPSGLCHRSSVAPAPKQPSPLPMSPVGTGMPPPWPTSTISTTPASPPSLAPERPPLPIVTSTGLHHLNDPDLSADPGTRAASTSPDVDRRQGRRKGLN
jgi:hypothetical protein